MPTFILFRFFQAPFRFSTVLYCGLLLENNSFSKQNSKWDKEFESSAYDDATYV